MAIEVGTAYLSILPSTSKLAPAIKAELGHMEDEASRSGDAAGKKFGGRFKGAMGTFLKGGLLAGVAGVSALGAMGIATAADMEQAEISFTTMLGSGEKAKAFIADLTDFAAKTPFEFPGLQTAASSLISAGIATKDVLPIMQTLGDVTSGMGTGSEGIQRATIALQQMNAAGKVTGEDLNQLRDAGIPVYDLLSKSMGKTKAEVAELASKGKLGAEGLNAIMSGLKSGKGLERFSGLMEKQSASLTGMWSTFKDTLGMGLAKAVAPLIPLLKQGLGAASEKLAALMPKVAAGLKTAVGWVVKFAAQWQAGTGAAGKAKAVLGGLKDTIAAVVSFMVRWQAVIIPLAAGVLTLVAGIKAYRAAIAAWQAIVRAATAVQATFNAVMAMNPIALVVIALVAVGVALVVAYKKSETFRNIVNGAFEKVKGAGQAIASFFTQKIPAAFDKVLGSARSVWGWIKAKWPLLLAILTGPFGLAVYAIVRNWDKIKSGATAAKNFVVSKFDALVGFFRSMPGRMTSAVSGLWDGLKNGFRSAINSIIGWWNGLHFSFDIPNKIPGLPDSFSINTPDVPMLAKGGVLNRATLNVAGEAGPEAVTPLDRLEGWIDRAAQIGASNAEARGYANPRAVSGASSGARRTEFVITNWRTGEGFFREIAEDAVEAASEFDGMTRRMR